jgi:AcrR family transcriptional regulator
MAAKTELTTIELIRGAALELLEKEGAEGVSMRKVAKKVGITPMAIYHHFPNRDALLTAVTDSEFERLAEYLRTAIGGKGDVLVNAVSGYIDYAFSRPRVFDYVFAQKRKGARRFPVDIRARKSPTLTLLADEVGARMKAGELRRDDVWEVVLAIWALVHGLVVLHRGKRIDLSEKEFRALGEHSLQRLIHGLKKQKI